VKFNKDMIPDGDFEISHVFADNHSIRSLKEFKERYMEQR
jgi:hypothetical protein